MSSPGRITSRAFRASTRISLERVALATTPLRSNAFSRRAHSKADAGQRQVSKSSDMPWLIGSVVITVAGLAAVFSTGPSVPESHKREVRTISDSDEEKEADEDNQSDEGDNEASSKDSNTDNKDDKEENKDDTGDSEKSAGDNKSTDKDAANSQDANKKEKGDKQSPSSDSSDSKQSAVGQETPSAPADNSSVSENREEKKKGHEEYKKIVSSRDTKTATSSSDMPSKKTKMEHPREDPQKGGGEGAKKGGSD